MLSFIVGALGGLSQYRVKRLLAYSSISHVGFLILALAVNSVSSVNSLLFYLVQTTFFSLARLGSARLGQMYNPPLLSPFSKISHFYYTACTFWRHYYLLNDTNNINTSRGFIYLYT